MLISHWRYIPVLVWLLWLSTISSVIPGSANNAINNTLLFQIFQQIFFKHTYFIFLSLHIVHKTINYTLHLKCTTLYSLHTVIYICQELEILPVYHCYTCMQFTIIHICHNQFTDITSQPLLASNPVEKFRILFQ